ncbi:MAG TPA: class I SAM-dependent methyltransferase [Micromonosporaceae bacterium]|nr:class I SAM-dependent methyltransferase [Micromonosporaceae bacterium]
MAQVNGDTHVQSAVLEDLSDAVNYRRWLADLARPHLGARPLEIGSGVGHYVHEWLPDVTHFTATEADDYRLCALKERFAGEPKVEVRSLFLPAGETGEHTAVVGLNVLEHIEDHVEALRSVSRLVHPGGAVVLLVPAFQSAMSRFDRVVGHVRRYTAPSMRSVLAEADLHIEQLRYVNPVGLVGWYAVCKMLGQFPSNGPVLRAYDRYVVPALRRAERHWQPPFGQSVFAVARTPDRRT